MSRPSKLDGEIVSIQEKIESARNNKSLDIALEALNDLVELFFNHHHQYVSPNDDRENPFTNYSSTESPSL